MDSEEYIIRYVLRIQHTLLQLLVARVSGFQSSAPDLRRSAPGLCWGIFTPRLANFCLHPWLLNTTVLTAIHHCIASVRVSARHSLTVVLETAVCRRREFSAMTRSLTSDNSDTYTQIHALWPDADSVQMAQSDKLIISQMQPSTHQTHLINGQLNSWCRMQTYHCPSKVD